MSLSHHGRYFELPAASGSSRCYSCAGIGISFEKSLYGSGATRAHGAVQWGHSAFIGGVWIGACFDEMCNRRRLCRRVPSA